VKTINATEADIEQHRSLTELLQLQDLVVVDQEYDDHHELILVICVPRWPASVCPDCGRVSDQVHDYPRQRAVHDAPIRGYASQLVFDMRRFWCEACKRAFSEAIREVVPDCTYTYRLMRELANPRRRQDVATLAEVYGLGYKLVEGIVLRAAEEKLAERAQEPIQVTHLGIDEIANRKGQGDYRLVLTDLKGRQLLDMLPDRRKESLIEWLQDPPAGIDLSELSWVATDLWAHYRDGVLAVYPQIKVVADRFHVTQALHRVIHEVRRDLQAQAQSDEEKSELKGLRYLLLKNQANLTEKNQARLERLAQEQPQLHRLWTLRQELHDWYEADHTLEQARSELDDWLEKAQALGWEPLNTFCKTLTAWKDEVVNFFPSADHQRLC
jgi:transposase